MTDILQELLILSEDYKKNLIGVSIRGKLVTKKTRKVTWKGDFYCAYKSLTSLEGAPTTIDGYLDCSNNRLTSLEGGPTLVEDWFDCSNNMLVSLKGAPKVNGSFNCKRNALTSLEGIPSVIGLRF